MLEGAHFGCPVPISLLSGRNCSLAGISEPLPFAFARGKGQGLEEYPAGASSVQALSDHQTPWIFSPQKQKSGFLPSRQERVENRQKTKQVPFLNNIALILDAELLHLQYSCNAQSLHPD